MAKIRGAGSKIIRKEKKRKVTQLFLYLNNGNTICNCELIKFVFSDDLRLSGKQVRKKKKNEEPSNIVEEKKKKTQNEPKKDTAEDRAKKELEKIAAYQARLAKKSNKQKKIKVVMDESNRDFAKKGITLYYFIILL